MGWSQNKTKLFRALLYAYPAEFRHEYGAEMEQLFTDRLQSEPHIRLWLEAIADIALSAPKEHWSILVSDLRYGARMPDFYDWQQSSHSFSSMAGLRQRPANLAVNGSPRRANTARVTGNFFSTLQVVPEIGRAISAEDDRPGHEHVAIISHDLWISEFDRAPSILGRQIQLDRQPYTIVGVAPMGFGYPFRGDIPFGQVEFRQTDIWLPFALTGKQKTVRDMPIDTDAAIGRLRPGVSASTAEAELKAIEARLQKLYPPQWQGWTAKVKPVVLTILGPVQNMLWLLLGAVAIVLLTAVSNVANLLLARITARAHEMGIRSALGAERARIVRQLLTESLLLSCTGGLFGVALAYALVRLLVRLNPGNIPRFDTASVDARVLLVGILLSVLTGVLCGLGPTISASRTSVSELLKQGGNKGTAGSSNRWRHALIVLEVALSMSCWPEPA
jgi:predicted permease